MKFVFPVLTEAVRQFGRMSKQTIQPFLCAPVAPQRDHRRLKGITTSGKEVPVNGFMQANREQVEAMQSGFATIRDGVLVGIKMKVRLDYVLLMPSRCACRSITAIRRLRRTCGTPFASCRSAMS